MLSFNFRRNKQEADHLEKPATVQHTYRGDFSTQHPVILQKINNCFDSSAELKYGLEVVEHETDCLLPEFEGIFFRADTH